MPRWEYDKNKKLESWQARSEELAKGTMNLTKNIETLTYLLIILTFVLITINIWRTISRYRKQILGTEGLMISVYFFLNTSQFIEAILIILFLTVPSFILLFNKISRFWHILLVISLILVSLALNLPYLVDSLKKLQYVPMEGAIWELFAILLIIIFLLATIEVSRKDLVQEG